MKWLHIPITFLSVLVLSGGCKKADKDNNSPSEVITEETTLPAGFNAETTLTKVSYQYNMDVIGNSEPGEVVTVYTSRKTDKSFVLMMKLGQLAIDNELTVDKVLYHVVSSGDGSPTRKYRTVYATATINKYDISVKLECSADGSEVQALTYTSVWKGFDHHVYADLSGG